MASQTDDERPPASDSRVVGAQEPAGEIQRLFVFTFAGQTFCVPLGAVVEIVETKDVDPYPGSLPHCRGTTNHRGRILPVFDPHGLSFGVEAGDSTASCVVIITCEGASFGLILERYLQLLELPASSIREPGRAPSSDAPQQATLGMLPYKGAAMTVISPEFIAGIVNRAFGTQAGPEPAARTEDPGAGEQWDVFILSRIGGASVAHPVNGVLEIVEGLDVTPLFSVDPCLRGLTNLRGRVLACIDVSDVIALPPRMLDDRSIFLVLSANGAEFALCVDEVMGIRTLPVGAFTPSAGLLQSPARTLFDSVAEQDGDTFLKLAAGAIVQWDRLASLRASAVDE